MTNKFVKTAGKVAVYTFSVFTTAALVEMGYHGGRMLINDVDYTVKAVDSKVNPKIMKKRHWYSKPELYNTRTKKFVNDKKTKKNK